MKSKEPIAHFPPNDLMFISIPLRSGYLRKAEIVEESSAFLRRFHIKLAPRTEQSSKHSEDDSCNQQHRYARADLRMFQQQRVVDNVELPPFSGDVFLTPARLVHDKR